MSDRPSLIIGGAIIVVGMIVVGILISAEAPLVAIGGFGLASLASGVAVLRSERIIEALSDRFPIPRRWLE